MTALQVQPHEASLRPGGEQQLIVTGVIFRRPCRGCDALAKYDSGDEGVATVDNNGHVTMHSYGEAPVTAVVSEPRHVFAAADSLSYHLQEAVVQESPRHNYIDDAILEHLESPAHSTFAPGK